MANTTTVSAPEKCRPARSNPRFRRPALALEEIALSLVDPINVATRDVHTLVERESSRLDRRDSVRRRVGLAQGLFAHPVTPALAGWLIRYACPARLEIGLAEAHRVVAEIRTGTMTSEVGAARLIRTAERSWNKEQSETNGTAPDVLAYVPAASCRNDSLGPEVLAVLARAAPHLTQPAAQLILETVDQAVDYLADEAKRSELTGPAVLQPRAARELHRDRRPSARVASGHPAGRSLRRLVLGRDGLVAYALRERLRDDGDFSGQRFSGVVARGWAVIVTRIEAALASQRSGSTGAHTAAA